jgi:cell division protein FtsB
MKPRKTQQGAKAKTSRTPSRSRATVASSRTRKKPVRAQSRKRPARPSGRLFSAAIVFVAIVALAWVFYPVASVSYRETREARRLSAELSALRQRNDRRRAQVDRLRTPAGVEDYARSELGMVKKGENVMVVVDDSAAKESSKAVSAPGIDSDETVREPVGPWTALLDLVFGVQ